MRVRVIVRAASPMPFQASVPVLSSPTLLEPGVFGILRPVLLLPEGITGHLSAGQLESIFAHELCHVRRRDNLAAAIHMFVEALFWFHPLVWWIGVRMVEERERACDEEVLRLGNQPQVYAESILKACQFYLESPLACVSGVTGSDLKKRIVRIMTQRMAVGLNLRKKLLLATAAIAAVAAPILLGLINAPQSYAQSKQASSVRLLAFEVASIKPNHSGGSNISMHIAPGGRFTARNITVRQLIENAYDIHEFQVSGAPSWLDSARYDISGKSEESIGAALDNLPPAQIRDKFMQMLQSLLTERFKLAVSHETKNLPGYALVVTKNGPKISKSTYKEPEKLIGSPPTPGEKSRPRPGISMDRGGKLSMTYEAASMLASVLSDLIGRIVVDQTGLAGKYDLTLQWTPDQGYDSGMPGPLNSARPSESSGPSLFTAIQEQLGLKLQSKNVPVDVLVIDHVEKPSEN